MKIAATFYRKGSWKRMLRQFGLDPLWQSVDEQRKEGWRMGRQIGAVILAAGQGKRMHTKVAKQFLELKGKPLLCHTLEAFEKSRVDHIVLVAGEEQICYCEKEIVQAWGFSKVKAVVPGGKERYHSVYEGLKALFPVFKPEPSGCVHPVFTPGLSGCVRPVSKPGATGFVFSGGDEDGLWHDDAAFLKGGEDEEWYVLIHDGARPLVSEAVIQRAIEGAVKYRACVVGMPVKDTIKVSSPEGFASGTPDRKTLWQIQTPQAFDFGLLFNAYGRMLNQPGCQEGITDDGMVVEAMTSCPVKLIEGDYRNIKVTTWEDLLVAEAFLEQASHLA
ncbi:MAG: 2-C-methyl-D-erythritol 4-phosphate cytidylyltransferase [Lachnospiraceae bacterium]|nr:2-C-methyl-D-erythritol 4-phosphate cytidylyltransferase [Lachnospiraceae bacterium]